MLTFRLGDPERPRGHALLFFHDADHPDAVSATYLVVAPIAMDIGKYLPPAFAGQMGGQLAAGAGEPAAYPLPPMPEKVEGGLDWLERTARARGDDLLDGGVLRVSEPWQALHPIAAIGAEYAEACTRYLADETAALEPAAAPPAVELGVGSAGATSSVDVDDLLLQVMPDREKIGRIARLTGTLRYAVEGSDRQLVADTVDEMRRVSRHLGDKYRLAELIEAAQSADSAAGTLVQLYVERCYKLVDEDYGAIADLDRRIETARQEG